MNQFYNTRNPADLWLNVGDFKKSFAYLCYPPGTISLITAGSGLKNNNSKARSASLKKQDLMLADSARCFPRLRPPEMAKTDRFSALPNISLFDINFCI